MTSQNLPSISTYIKNSYPMENSDQVNQSQNQVERFDSSNVEIKKCCVECLTKNCCICNKQIIKCKNCQDNEIDIEMENQTQSRNQNESLNQSWVTICPRKCCVKCRNKDGCYMLE